MDKQLEAKLDALIEEMRNMGKLLAFNQKQIQEALQKLKK